MNVLIGGGTGLVGTAVRELLEENGHRVAVLSRGSAEAGVKTFHWDIEQRTIDDAAIQFADAIVNLAGANIADGRWTLSRKKEIINSRVQSTQLLVSAAERMQKPLLAFVSASAVGYYGSLTREESFTEGEAPGRDFLGQTCELWEKAADLFKQLNVRTVKLRIGVVLSKDGGMLKELLPVFRRSLGVPLGSGKQYVPWVHIDDAAAMFLHALENPEMHGSYNAVSPNPVNNREFTKEVNKALDKKSILPNVPGFIVKLLFGGPATLMLDGSPVSAKKIMSTGYKFQYLLLNDALEDLV